MIQVRSRNGKYRLVDSDGRLARNAKGEVADRGGHEDKQAATRQAKSLTAALKRRNENGEG